MNILLKNRANLITLLRIILSIIIIFTDTFSPVFYILYVFCILSDIFDGIIARKYNLESSFGEKFDSISDIIFITVLSIKVLPYISLNKLNLIWITTLLILKVFAILIGYIKRKCLVMMHLISYKISGGILAFVILIMKVIDINIPIYFVLIFSTYAVIKEIYLTRNGDKTIKEYLNN